MTMLASSVRVRPCSSRALFVVIGLSTQHAVVLMTMRSATGRSASHGR
jgi:hypothetical protein